LKIQKLTPSIQCQDGAFVAQPFKVNLILAKWKKIRNPLNTYFDEFLRKKYFRSILKNNHPLYLLLRC